MVENEKLMNRKKQFKNCKYLIVVRQEEVEGGDDDWEGQVGEILNQIEGNVQVHNEYTKQLEHSLIKLLWTNADNLVNDIERKFNVKFQIVNKKLD